MVRKAHGLTGNGQERLAKMSEQPSAEKASHGWRIFPPHSFGARAIAGVKSCWRLGRVSGVRQVVQRVRAALWRRTTTLVFEAGADRTQTGVSLPPDLRIVRIQPGDPSAPLNDILASGAGDDILNLERGATCYLAYQRDVPVGLGWMFKDSYFLHRTGLGKEAFYLAGYHVVESARGQGLYPLLLRVMARDAALQGKSCFVDASPANRPSIRGIEKAGFGRVGTLRCLVVGGMILRADLTPGEPHQAQATGDIRPTSGRPPP